MSTKRTEGRQITKTEGRQITKTEGRQITKTEGREKGKLEKMNGSKIKNDHTCIRKRSGSEKLHYLQIFLLLT